MPVMRGSLVVELAAPVWISYLEWPEPSIRERRDVEHDGPRHERGPDVVVGHDHAVVADRRADADDARDGRALDDVANAELATELVLTRVAEEPAVLGQRAGGRRDEPHDRAVDEARPGEDAVREFGVS